MSKREKEAEAKRPHVPGRDDGGKPESIAWKIYSSVAAVAAGVMARKAVETAWVKATGKAPPEEPESPAVHWAEAVAWSAFSGTTVAIARLLATRKAAGAWQRVSEQSPTRSPSSDLERPEPAEPARA